MVLNMLSDGDIELEMPESRNLLMFNAAGLLEKGHTRGWPRGTAQLQPFTACQKPFCTVTLTFISTLAMFVNNYS
jgi:hypothetical protein